MPSTTSFVPKDYEVSSGGNDFLKLKTGENRFRILTDAVLGREGWSQNKPFRRPMGSSIDETEVDVDQRTGKPKISDFMAFYVYSYADEKVMIAEFTQVGIKKALVEYATDEDWGHPISYDISVTKTGEGMTTKYSVKPSVPKPLTKAIQTVIDDMDISTDAVEKALNIEAAS